MNVRALPSAEEQRARSASRIRALIRKDKLAEARRRLEALFAEDPDDPLALSLAGLAESQAENHQKAIRLAQESLAATSSPAGYRRSLEAFLEVAGAASQQAVIDRVLEAGIPVGDAGEPLLAEDVEVLLALADRLVGCRKGRQGLSLVDAFSTEFQRSARGLALSGILKAAAGRFEEALGDLAAAGELEPLPPAALLAGRLAATASDDGSLARAVTKEFLSRFPVYLRKPAADGHVLVGVATIFRPRAVEPSHILDSEAIYLPDDSVLRLFRRASSGYRVLSILANSPSARAAIRRAPRPDLIFAGSLRPEAITAYRAKGILNRLEKSWDVPAVNSVDRVVGTGRAGLHALLGGIDNLVVPRSVLLSGETELSDLETTIKGTFGGPVIIRDAVKSHGNDAFLVRNDAELRNALQVARGWRQFHAIEFVDIAHDRGLHRRMRAAVIGDTLRLVRVDVDQTWNVHGVAAAPLPAREADICADPDRGLSSATMATLRSIRSRVPLDVFGIEFDVMPDGRVLMFDLHASMDLLSADADVAGRVEGADAAVMAAFDALVRLTLER